MNLRLDNSKLILPAILVICALSGVMFIRAIPPWQSPDEPTHFEYAQVLATGGSPWATESDPGLQSNIIKSMARHRFWELVGVPTPVPLPLTFRATPFLYNAPTQIGKNPPLYYLVASFALKIFKPNTLEGALYLLRFLSLIFTLFTVWTIWACAGEIFGSNPISQAAVALGAGLLPQFMVIGTSISPDPLINLLGAIAIYLSLKLLRSGFSLSRVLLILLVHGSGLLVGYKFLIMIAVLPFIFLICFIKKGTAFPTFKVLAGGVALLILGLFFYCWICWRMPNLARVFIVRLEIFQHTFFSWIKGKTHFPPGFWSWFNLNFFQGFWLKFGWLKYGLSDGCYRSLWIITLLGGIGAIKGWLSNRAHPGRLFGGLVLYAGTGLGVYYLYWGLQGTGATTQARHLFIGLAAWSCLFIWAWSCLFPLKKQEVAASLIILGAISFNLIALLGYIIPSFSLSAVSPWMINLF